MHLQSGSVQGDFPMPNENKKIDIPGFTSTKYSPCFFIIDAQGKRIFPQNTVYAALDNIWEAYKELTTLPEKDIQRSYDKYVQ